MRKTRRIIPFVFCGLLISCTTERRLARVRISQPQMKETVADTGKQLPGQIAWTDDKGEEHLVKQVSHDSVTGENMTLIELSEVTVMAKSKQVAERNGKINLDFLVTVPGELINNKWQVQLTPVAYKPSDTLYLDKIFLSGADFAKMQEKGYMRYRAFMNSIIPDSLYMQRLLDSKGYKKALAELEEEYFQAWKHEVIAKERWVDWSDKTNARFALFNYKMERNRQAIAGYNSILEYLPAYWMRREIDGKYIPSKWKMFAEGNYKIRTRSITPEDSAIDWLESEDFGPAPGVIVISDVADGARVKANGTFEWTVKNNVRCTKSMCGFLMSPHAWIRSSGKATASCIITSRSFPPPKTRRR